MVVFTGVSEMLKSLFAFVLVFVCVTGVVWADDGGEFFEISGEVLRDKIRGGLLGQMLGNLNGLEHEMKYIGEPGDVKSYVPALPDGAWTDDDTDFEWVYIVAMAECDTVFIPAERIASLWKERINKRIWCSNQYARQLMDLGFVPPLTGNVVLNPWAEFNISGQFLCETFGLLGPGMPQTAGRIGLHYTRVAIDGEPAQTTQLFCAMIATAFVSEDMEAILDAGVAAVDEGSVIGEVVADVRRWYGENARDWRATRRLVKEKYSRYGGAMRDKNGYELNTASIIAALLYGGGDVTETLRVAFNFGWDADCNAATAGTIVGVIKGYRWMMSQGWDIRDRYRNTTREDMPANETITSFGDRVMELAERVILERGGQRRFDGGRVVYRIRGERSANVLALAEMGDLVGRMRKEMGGEIEAAIVRGSDDVERARGAYLAICLELAGVMRKEHPGAWGKAVEALENNSKVVQVLFYHSPVPLGEKLREKALAASVTKPAKRENIW